MSQRTRGMLARTKSIVIIAMLNAFSFSSTILAAPAAYDPRLEIKPSSWQDNALTPIISSPCSVGERCWGWLPAVPVNRDDAYVLQDESNGDRFQSERQLNREIDSAMDPWKEESPLLVSEIRPASPVTRQISQRPVKKDFFMSRSWGPGGLPFSVLYMNPHTARSNHPNTGITEATATKATPNLVTGRSLEVPLPTIPPPRHPNGRVALRNGATGQQRRQYSIIPQLFISYGWGPLGK